VKEGLAEGCRLQRQRRMQVASGECAGWSPKWWDMRAFSRGECEGEEVARRKTGREDGSRRLLYTL
jgi:hypothetical protein